MRSRCGKVNNAEGIDRVLWSPHAVSLLSLNTCAIRGCMPLFKFQRECQDLNSPCGEEGAYTLCILRIITLKSISNHFILTSRHAFSHNCYPQQVKRFHFHNNRSFKEFLFLLSIISNIHSCLQSSLSSFVSCIYFSLSSSFQQF